MACNGISVLTASNARLIVESLKRDLSSCNVDAGSSANISKFPDWRHEVVATIIRFYCMMLQTILICNFVRLYNPHDVIPSYS
jgi:hypothetical protein